MALRLVRQTSETPNITNKDDTIMTRYAYGGYNGVVKALGSECGYTSESGIFKILDGRICVDGWEIDIDGAGYSLDLSNVVGIQYYSVYIELNVALETASIKPTFLQGVYPEITKGDDLTQTPNGTARLLLYNVKVENGRIIEVVKKFEIIPYLTAKVLDIEKRLTEMGFKQGAFSLADESTVDENSIKKQGKYVIANLISGYFSSCTVPEEFRPNESILVSCGGKRLNGKNIVMAEIRSNGNVTFYDETDNKETTPYEVSMLNVGWECK